jgi:hypothetical protein
MGSPRLALPFGTTVLLGAALCTSMADKKLSPPPEPQARQLQEVWSAPAADVVDTALELRYGSASDTAAASTDPRLFIWSGDPGAMRGSLLSLDAGTGRQLWNRSIHKYGCGTHRLNAPFGLKVELLAPDFLVLFCQAIAVISRKTGDLVWSVADWNAGAIPGVRPGIVAVDGVILSNFCPFGKSAQFPTPAGLFFAQTAVLFWLGFTDIRIRRWSGSRAPTSPPPRLQPNFLHCFFCPSRHQLPFRIHPTRLY